IYSPPNHVRTLTSSIFCPFIQANFPWALYRVRKTKLSGYGREVSGSPPGPHIPLRRGPALLCLGRYSEAMSSWFGKDGVLRADASEGCESATNVSKNEEYRACGRMRRTMSGSDLRSF